MSDDTTPIYYRVSPINFKTRANRQLRRRVYVRDIFTCRECGWSPPMSEDEKAAYSGGETPVSFDPFRYLQVDHITPRCLGGSHDEVNLQTLCNSCNGRKSGRMP